MSCFIIAEAGVNHNGDLKTAKKMIEIAANAGANAIKFQTFRAENLVTPSAVKAEYQQQQTGNGSQYEMLKSLELNDEVHIELATHCKYHQIEFMSTAFSHESLDFLLQLGMQRIKIPSGEITHTPFIEYIASKNLPIILSTGMANLDEVKEAIDVIRQVRSKYEYSSPLDKILTILHCTSNYPTSLDDVNLRAIQTLAQTFSLPVGYSDHTLGVLVPPLAVAMGASVIEKHFTLDKNSPGPDHQASLDSTELVEMVHQIRNAQRCLGDGIKQARPKELAVRDLVRRSVTLKTAKNKNSKIELEDLCLLRPGTGIPPKSLHNIIGKTLKQNLAAHTTLKWQHLEEGCEK